MAPVGNKLIGGSIGAIHDNPLSYRAAVWSELRLKRKNEMSQLFGRFYNVAQFGLSSLSLMAVLCYSRIINLVEASMLARGCRGIAGAAVIPIIGG